MEYHISKIVNCSYEEALENAVQALGRHGFGVLTEIDVAATLKKKLDVDFRKYKILGACNPKLAHRALTAEDKVGTLLPCNVVVQEHESGQVEVSAMNPGMAMQMIDNAELQEVAQTVTGLMQNILDEL